MTSSSTVTCLRSLTSNVMDPQEWPHVCDMYALRKNYDPGFLYGSGWVTCKCENNPQIGLAPRNERGLIPCCQFCPEPINVSTDRYLCCTSCLCLQHLDCKPKYGHKSSMTKKFYDCLKEKLWWLKNLNQTDYVKESRYVCHLCSPNSFMTAPFKIKEKYGRFSNGRFSSTPSYRPPFTQDMIHE